MLDEFGLSLRLMPRQLRFYPTVDSTNDLAIEWLKDGAGQGAVIIADEQVKGRGRLGRTWHTPPDSAIAMSVILRPSREQAAFTSMIGAVAVAKAVQALGAENVGIKWPNDVQIAGKKIAGILPEAVWQDDQLLGVVLGMGINVRNVLSPELAEVATNLEMELDRNINRADLVASVLEEIEDAVALPSEDLVAVWRQFLTTIGQTVTINDVTGVACDVDEQGALVVETENGQRQRMIAGDVFLR
jgi:BirA family biotin operon repressor/biotin-[acetyl-CoA-carboxylase] ligase